jgi:hypothetical protein
MAKTKSAKNRERQRVSAKAFAESSGGDFTSTHLNLPTGTKLVRFKKKGTLRWDIIPFKAGEKRQDRVAEGTPVISSQYWVHRNVSANANELFVCVRMTHGKKCAICDVRDKMQADPDADPKDIADIKPKLRTMFALKDVGKNAETDETQVFDNSFYNFGEQLKERLNAEDDEEEDDHESFADPVDGETLKVTVIGDSVNGGKEYFKAGGIEFIPRKAAYDPDIIDETPCLDSCLHIEPYDKLMAIFQAVEEDEDEDDDKKKGKKKAPVKKGASTKGKKKPVDDDDEDEDEEDDTDDEDDEDEPAPAKGKGKKAPAKKKPADEDDDDDEDDEPAGIAIDDTVMHKKHGACEVIKLSGDRKTCSIEDADGEVHTGIKVTDLKLVDDDDEDEDEDDEPAAKKKSAPAKGKKAPANKKPADDEDDEDEDEEDDTDDEDDEDDDDEPPAKKAPAKGAKSKTPVKKKR